MKLINYNIRLKEVFLQRRGNSINILVTIHESCCTFATVNIASDIFPTYFFRMIVNQIYHGKLKMLILKIAKLLQIAHTCSGRAALVPKV